MIFIPAAAYMSGKDASQHQKRLDTIYQGIADYLRTHTDHTDEFQVEISIPAGSVAVSRLSIFYDKYIQLYLENQGYVYVCTGAVVGYPPNTKEVKCIVRLIPLGIVHL